MVYSRGRLNIRPPATPRPYSRSDSVIERSLIFVDLRRDINRSRDVRRRKAPRVPTQEILGEIELKHNCRCRLPQTTLEKAKVKESRKTNWVPNAGSLRGMIEVASVNPGQIYPRRSRDFIFQVANT